MPKEKEFRKVLPEIIKKQAEDIALLFYIRGLQKGLPAVTDSKAVEIFLKEHGFTEEEFPFETARLIYVEMKKLYFKEFVR